MTTVEQVHTYCDCIFEPADIVEVRAIVTDGAVRKLWCLAGDLASLLPELERLNLSGFNIYVGPNPRKAKGLSGDRNVGTFRTLFADFDGVSPGDGCGIWEFIEPKIEAARLPTPDLVVFSGHGCHAYWRATAAMEPDHWRTLQKRLIATLESDPKVANPERLLRLPGFVNQKYKTPADCFLLFTPEVAVCL